MNKITRSFIVRIASLLFVAFCFLSIIRLQFKNNEVKAQIEDMSQQIAVESDACEELKRLKEQPFDDAYIEQVAREELDYRDPGEIIFYNDN